MSGYRLFYDDEFEALRQMVEAGAGYKKTAAHLWPGMKPESAYARLKICLSPEGDQRLKFNEIIAAMKFNGRFDPLFFACDELQHDRPVPRKPEDEKAQLQREFIESVDAVKKLAERIERLTRSPLEAVK